jgi:uncharacterized protein YkwD
VRHPLLAATLLAAAFALSAAAEAVPILGPAPLAGAATTAPEQLVLVGKGNGNGNGNFGADINRARNDRNRDNVRVSSPLERAAQDYAQTLSRGNHFSHTGRDGSSPQDRARAANCRCVAVAENLAKGHRNTDQVFDAWMGSSGHRANMMGRNYEKFGLGHAGDVWVLMLSD